MPGEKNRKTHKATGETADDATTDADAGRAHASNDSGSEMTAPVKAGKRMFQGKSVPYPIKAEQS